MTEKRYGLTEDRELIDNELGSVYMVKGRSALYLCNELNHLHEETQELKHELSEQGIQIDFLEAENQHMRDLINENKQLKEENQRLKAQLFADHEEGVCHICKHQYLIKHPQIQGCYIAKCKKAYEECSKESLNYCEDFEIKEDIE